MPNTYFSWRKWRSGTSTPAELYFCDECMNIWTNEIFLWKDLLIFVYPRYPYTWKDCNSVIYFNPVERGERTNLIYVLHPKNEICDIFITGSDFFFTYMWNLTFLAFMRLTVRRAFLQELSSSFYGHLRWPESSPWKHQMLGLLTLVVKFKTFRNLNMHALKAFLWYSNWWKGFVAISNLMLWG